MKNIATEYIENVYSPALHSTLFISGKVWDQSVVISTMFVRLIKRNISVKSTTNMVIQIKQTWCHDSKLGV
jgi:hypothetical protein